MNNSNNPNFIIPDEWVESKNIGAIRVGFDETDIILEFGTSKVKETNEIKVIGRYNIRADMLKNIIHLLYEAGKAYEEEHKKDIGFSNLEVAAK